MTEAIQNVLVAFLAAVPPTLLAWAALRQSRVTAEKTEENTQITKETAVKTDENTVLTKQAAAQAAVAAEGTKTTLDEIHTLTNSNLSRVMADLGIANDRIISLEKLVNRLLEQETENGHGIKHLEEVTGKKANQ
jgi:hypothetical protein